MRVVHGHVAWDVFGNDVKLFGCLDTRVVVDADLRGLVAGKAPNGSNAFGSCDTGVVSAKCDGHLDSGAAGSYDS